jgi:uncharacterized protein
VSLLSQGRLLVLSAFVTGLVFGAGLLMSGMTQPTKVIAFLDVFSGRWDPSLALVMAGAIGVHALLFRVILKRPTPLIGQKFHLPTRKDIDPRLVLGAALFGVGWALGGVCPGPGLVALASLSSSFLLFGGGLFLGMGLFRLVHRS